MRLAAPSRTPVNTKLQAELSFAGIPSVGRTDPPISTATLQRSRHGEFAAFGLFLLPGGLPRRFVAAIHAGGRPRRLDWPAAIPRSPMAVLRVALDKPIARALRRIPQAGLK
jgi:hypothetical protein